MRWLITWEPEVENSLTYYTLVARLQPSLRVRFKWALSCPRCWVRSLAACRGRRRCLVSLPDLRPSYLNFTASAFLGISSSSSSSNSTGTDCVVARRVMFHYGHCGGNAHFVNARANISWTDLRARDVGTNVVEETKKQKKRCNISRSHADEMR